MSFGRRALLDAYLGDQGEEAASGYRPHAPAYNEALRAYHRDMLAALQRLFGLALNAEGVGSFDNKVHFMLFRSVCASLLSIRTPGSGFLEGGLLLKKLEEAGEAGQRVQAAWDRGDAALARAREAYLTMLDDLLAIMLADRADATFTAADLLGAGATSVEPPDTAGFDMYEDF